jgi:selenocysteine-specific elongation factor
MAGAGSNWTPKPGGAERTVTLTVGTAGHIDHGKTSLVKCLTGCDTDTLPEEKARGMTIDLGFATCLLPGDRRVGIVDVPGHERFIHNMVAGATGIDVVLLVVAADDGVMPQTVEHFHIVRLLGIKSGMVAVTKIDMIAPERVADVVAQVRDLVAGSFLEGCPIVPVSSKTGEGFDAFYAAFTAIVDQTAQRDASGAFRMHVERAFVLQGLGSIASGIPGSGTVRVGDSVELLPAGGVKKVRGVQVYGADAPEGRAGECVALRLGDVSHGEIVRGMVLATPGYCAPTRLVSARFHAVPSLTRPLKPRTAVRFHIGTTDVTGYLVLPELAPLAPGADAYVQFQLNDPVVAAPGDFFVARLLSPVMTIGGGTVVAPETMKLRRSRGDWAETVRERDQAFHDPAAALGYVLKQAGAGALPLAELARQAFLSVEAARTHVAELVRAGGAVDLGGDRYVDAAAMPGVCAQVMAVIGRMHDAAPLSLGFARKDVLRELSGDRNVVEKAISQLLEAGTLRQLETGYQDPARAPRLSPAQAALAAKLVETYRRTGFASPRRDELPALVGAPAAALDPVFDHLVQVGELVVLSDKVVLDKGHVAESRRRLADYLAAHGTLESGAFKDVIGSTRKYSIPILEYWDAKGLTRRVGNNRVLKEKR